MAIMPRPVSPRSAFADLKLMFSADRPHRWTLLGLSATLTALLIWTFLHDTVRPTPERQIIYVESWMADRKDSDIIRQQQADLANFEAALERKKKRYQKVADMSGIEWREDEAKERARRAAVVAAIRKQLDERLAASLAQEAQGGIGADPARDAAAP
jgi:hypothetical protein